MRSGFARITFSLPQRLLKRVLSKSLLHLKIDQFVQGQRGSLGLCMRLQQALRIIHAGFEPFLLQNPHEYCVLTL
jgi:hypothetical protein